jgi:sporulation protein YlmC with PRC-barrel domain
MKKSIVFLSLLLGLGLVLASGAYAVDASPGAWGWPAAPAAPATKAPVSGETGVSSSAGPPASGQPIPSYGTGTYQSQSNLPPGHPPVGTAAVTRPGVMASDLIGSTVVSRNGDEIGTVDDLVVDPVSGRVSYAVIDPSAVSGMSDRLIAVPIASLRQSPGQDRYVLNIDSARLNQAPAMTREDMTRAVGDPNFNNQVRDFFGTALPGTGSGGSPGGP